jgi:hypothetical protein
MRPSSRVHPAAAAALVALLALAAGAALPARAEVQVKLKLPQRAKLDLRGKDSVTIAPFIVVAKESEAKTETKNIDVEKEFRRYLEKILRRETDLRVIDPGPINLPSFQLDDLVKNADFWREVGDKTQAGLIVTGSLDFDIQDRSGYKTQEFVSPVDGRTYYRQELVEQTGFEYDILMVVMDGGTGKELYRDNFKDFQSFQKDDVSAISGMFENLYSLEDRILAVFTQKEIETTRVLFTHAR